MADQGTVSKYRQDKDVDQIAAAATLTPIQTVVELSTTVAAFDLTLAPPDNCKGVTVSLRLKTGATNACTVKNPQGDANWIDLVLDADEDGCLLYCDGLTLWVASNEIA